VPNVLRGKFLNIVIPAMKVVQKTVPNHMPKESIWTVAAAFEERMRCLPNLPSAFVVAEGDLDVVYTAKSRV